MFSGSKKNYICQRNRIKFLNDEIFFSCCLLLEQSKFSNGLYYFFFKSKQAFIYDSKIRNNCLFSKYKRSVSSRFKLSRQLLSYKILTGSMVGFYKAS